MSWKAFVAKQVGEGAAAAHQLVKHDGAECADASTIGTGSMRTASPQKMLEHDLQAWRQVRLRFGDEPTAPWRSTAELPKLPSITADDTYRTARSFPRFTSVGCDVVLPAAIADLSHQLRSALATILKAAEDTGTWPGYLNRAEADCALERFRL